MLKEEVIKKLVKVVKDLTEKDLVVSITIPNDTKNGDWASSVAFQLAKELHISPLEAAQKVVAKLEEIGDFSGIHSIPQGDYVQGTVASSGSVRVEAVAPGFVNFYLTNPELKAGLEEIIKTPATVGRTQMMAGKKIMVEFAHPNTHKEMHIGHMRTLITGEALSRLLESQGATVFRANYQGDIGPHVAKAIYGVEKMIEEKGLNLDEIEEWSYPQKAHFLGEGYVRGNQDYDEANKQIDEINNTLYRKEPGHYWDLYLTTHKWSMDYYDEFYSRFYTKFDRLFLESEMYEKGKEIVEENVGKVFTRDEDGSIIFRGEPYGLHTRVFVTKAGNPTYEGKEMQNAFTEWEAFHFDQKIHVVASEQAGYFKVIFKALELLDPGKFEDKQYHLSMGMVQLVGRKMSSRTGDIMTVDWLVDQVKAASEELFKEGKLLGEERDIVLEQVSVGAVKYSVLKGGTGQNTVFDIEKSVSLDGNSGPYIQYSYARTQSVLGKSNLGHLAEAATSIGSSSQERDSIASLQNDKEYIPQKEEVEILRKLYHFSEVVEDAATTYSPNVVTEYLFALSQLFNNFYQKYRILNAPKEEEKAFRLSLTQAVGIVLKRGLNLLGIEAPEKM